MTNFFKLAFLSLFRYERVALKGHVTLTTSNPPYVNSVLIPHNLGYEPYFKAWITFDGVKFFQLFAGNASLGIAGNNIQITDCHADSTNLIVEMTDEAFTPGVVTTATIYYRIYAEPQTA